MNERSIESLLSERQSTHGDFTDNARMEQMLRRAMHSGRNWDQLNDVQKTALGMVAHKIARILGGNPTTIDHWQDIIGYVQLVIDRTPRRPADPRPHVDRAMDIATEHARIVATPPPNRPATYDPLRIDPDPTLGTNPNPALGWPAEPMVPRLSPAVDPALRGPRHCVPVIGQVSQPVNLDKPWIEFTSALLQLGDFAMVERWYRPVGTQGLNALQPWVPHEGDATDRPPKGLVGVYSYAVLDILGEAESRARIEGWLLDIAHCPPDLRSHYWPELRFELNHLEYMELVDDWHRGLYVWLEDGRKYQLRQPFHAWHVRG